MFSCRLPVPTRLPANANVQDVHDGADDEQRWQQARQYAEKQPSLPWTHMPLQTEPDSRRAGMLCPMISHAHR